MFGELLAQVRKSEPLIHCITNYVTVNDCANVLLAAGASPIMADDADEAAEITPTPSRSPGISRGRPARSSSSPARRISSPTAGRSAVSATAIP